MTARHNNVLSLKFQQVYMLTFLMKHATSQRTSNLIVFVSHGWPQNPLRNISKVDEPGTIYLVVRYADY